PAPPLMRSSPRPPLMSSLPRPPLARSSPAWSDMCSPRAPPVTLSSPGLPAPAAIADVANASMSSAPARAAMSRILDIEVALRDAAYGVDELLHVGDAVLEQVADAAAPVGQQLGRERALDVLREDEHRQARHLHARLERRADALVGERRRQPDVDDADVRLV